MQDDTRFDNLPTPPPQDVTPVGQDLDRYLADEYEVKEPRRGDLKTGIVIQVDDSGALVDCGFKREGFVPAEDLNRLDQATRARVQVGASIPVYVVNPQNRDGQPILSVEQALAYEDWLKAEQMRDSNELYEGVVAGYNRGGLVVKFGEIRGFVPASQIAGLPRRLREDERRRRLEAMIGKPIGLRVIEVDRARRRLIFSQRRALRAWQEMKRQQVMSSLAAGDVRRGHVTDITSFGAFVDLGGADGLVHVSELSWRRVDDPHQVLKIGQELDVYVLSVDQDRKRIALSCKKLQPDPWTLVDQEYQIGQLVEGRVTRVLDFGAFVELDLGVEGLLHASEMIGAPGTPPAEIVRPGDTVLVKIIRIESRRKRIALSAKQVSRSEWERWMAERRQAAAATAEATPEPDEAPGAAVPESERLEEGAAEEEEGIWEAQAAEGIEAEQDAEA